jgi:predicted transcriptional regulator
VRQQSDISNSADDNVNMRLIESTRDIVIAVLGGQTGVTGDILEGALTRTFKTLQSLFEGVPSETLNAKKSEKTVFPNHIVCLEDGKKFKSLKRHLRVKYNLSPDEYRKKWGLPSSYPMVAPSYSRQRSQLAKKVGLGRP